MSILSATSLIQTVAGTCSPALIVSRDGAQASISLKSLRDHCIDISTPRSGPANRMLEPVEPSGQPWSCHYVKVELGWSQTATDQ